MEDIEAEQWSFQDLMDELHGLQDEFVNFTLDNTRLRIQNETLQAKIQELEEEVAFQKLNGLNLLKEIQNENC